MSKGQYQMSDADQENNVGTDDRLAYHQSSPRARATKLAPLEKGGSKLPPLRGSFPGQTEQTMISVPGEDDRSLSRQATPGGEQLSSVGMPRIGSQSSNSRPLEVVVYFMDKTGIHLVVDDGQHCEAGDLFEMVMDEMKFPPIAREAFSLWLVSDLLEVQLKPTQVPFQLACFWEELLDKYTSAEDDDMQRDEPVIMFQRNVFFPLHKEKQLKNDVTLLRLLYHEAKENIVDSRYPLEQTQYDMLAGIQALITHRGYDPDEHTSVYYRPKIGDFYPEHIAQKKKWNIFRGKDAPEHRLAHWHHQASLKYMDLDLEKPEERKQCYLAYLEFCWSLPFYGAAFFKGQIEHPSGKGLRLRSSSDDPVYVAINTEGVFIIDMDDMVFLMGLLFHEMAWEYAEPQNQQDRNCMPCLFLQFKAKERGDTVTKLLQVFSREGVLMDALIEACIKLKNSTAGSAGDVKLQTQGETWQKFNRLSLKTFNTKA